MEICICQMCTEEARKRREETKKRNTWGSCILPQNLLFDFQGPELCECALRYPVIYLLLWCEYLCGNSDSKWSRTLQGTLNFLQTLPLFSDPSWFMSQSHKCFPSRWKFFYLVQMHLSLRTTLSKSVSACIQLCLPIVFFMQSCHFHSFSRSTEFLSAKGTSII